MNPDIEAISIISGYSLHEFDNSNDIIADNPIINPPNIEANNPNGVTPPFVPGGT
jgi:hypothetical protein